MFWDPWWEVLRTEVKRSPCRDNLGFRLAINAQTEEVFVYQNSHFWLTAASRWRWSCSPQQWQLCSAGFAGNTAEKSLLIKASSFQCINTLSKAPPWVRNNSRKHGREAKSLLYLLAASSSPRYGLGALGSVKVKAAHCSQAKPVLQPAPMAGSGCRGGWIERVIPNTHHWLLNTAELPCHFGVGIFLEWLNLSRNLCLPEAQHN